jgi:hypothetical protein
MQTESRSTQRPPGALTDAGLDEVCRRVRFHLQAAAAAAEKFLEHALATGEALITAKAQIETGGWLKWLKSCGLSEDKAARYMLLARHGKELDSARVRNLSLRAALKLIAKSPATASKKKPDIKPASSSFDALGWWKGASREERRRFLDVVGLLSIFEVMPSEWREKIEKRVHHRTVPTIIDGVGVSRKRLARDTNSD